jgi:threonine/homoserine/homoserine lactone efflux protein
MPGTASFWRDPALPHVESRRACHSRACYKPHSHPTFSIGAVDAGGSIFTGSHGRQSALSAGSLVLVAAGCVHACNPLPDALWSYQMLHLDARWLQTHAPERDGDTATVLHCPRLYAQFCAMNVLLFSIASAAEKDAALGCAYLFYLGWLLLRHAGKCSLDAKPATGKAHWRGGVVMGFVCAILNPKNALFYVSLATVLASRQTSTGAMVAYGAWMVFAVLAWDVTVALAIGSATLRQRFARALPLLERLSGVMLIVLAVALLANIASSSV